MGRIYKLVCTNKKCGYEKTAQIGEGQAGMRLDAIRDVFQDKFADELQEFEQYAANGLLDYSMGQRLTYCRNCRDYIAAHVLRYAVNGLTKVFYMPCEVCGDAPLPADINIAVNCLRCGETLTAEIVGMWD
jgi:hypothetical protein